MTANVFVEPCAAPVMVALVIGGHLDVLPAHVKNGNEDAVFVVDRNLRLWPGKSGTNQQQPQPRFPRRFRTGVDEAQGNASILDAAAAHIPFAEKFDVCQLESRRASESIDLCNRGTDGVSTSKVESGALRRRHEHSVDDLDLVVIEAIRPCMNPP